MNIRTITLTLFIFVALAGCGPNLHYSEPVANKDSNQTQFGTVYDELHVAMVKIYHQAQKGNYDKQVEPIEQAKKALWKLSLLRDGLVVSLREHKKQEQYVDELRLGKQFVESTNNLLIQSVRYLNVSQGYTHASFDSNLSYLTERNEALFNGLDIKLVQVSEVFLEDLKQFSISELGNLVISKKLPPREISLQIDTNNYPEEASRLQVSFKKHLEVYGFHVVPNNNSVLVVDIKDVEMENTGDLVGKVIITALIPNNSLGKTKNKLLVKTYLKSDVATCNINFLNEIDISLENWEELENFLARMAVEELRYGNCFTF
ncbi:hypothetical protein ACFL48_01390 [Pseudomonadota bacterium]